MRAIATIAVAGLLGACSPTAKAENTTTSDVLWRMEWFHDSKTGFNPEPKCVRVVFNVVKEMERMKKVQPGTLLQVRAFEDVFGGGMIYSVKYRQPELDLTSVFAFTEREETCLSNYVAYFKESEKEATP